MSNLVFVKSSKSFCFVFMILVSTLSCANDPGDQLRKKIRDNLKVSESGLCTNKAISVNMGDTVKIKNRVLLDEKRNRIIALNGENVYWQKVGEPSNNDEEKTVFDLDAAISEMLDIDDPDIDLEFILLDGEYAVSWRETFKHKQFRLGIYKFTDATLNYFCSGVGGISKSH